MTGRRRPPPWGPMPRSLGFALRATSLRGGRLPGELCGGGRTACGGSPVTNGRAPRASGAESGGPSPSHPAPFEGPGIAGQDGYLVDSASSHMLVSKIKPCMSKYKQTILRNCEWLIKSVIVYLIIPYYLDNRGNSRANTCEKPRLREGCIY